MERIETDYQVLLGTSMEELVSTLRKTHKARELKGMGKGELISMILSAKHGIKEVGLWRVKR